MLIGEGREDHVVGAAGQPMRGITDQYLVAPFLKPGAVDPGHILGDEFGVLSQPSALEPIGKTGAPGAQFQHTHPCRAAGRNLLQQIGAETFVEAGLVAGCRQIEVGSLRRVKLSHPTGERFERTGSTLVRRTHERPAVPGGAQSVFAQGFGLLDRSRCSQMPVNSRSLTLRAGIDTGGARFR